jgi:hypothetical protein
MSKKQDTSSYFEPIEGIHHLTEIENPRYDHTPMRIEGIVSSSTTSYLVPHEVSATWIIEDKQHEKTKVFNIFDPELINFVGVSESSKNKILGYLMGVPKKASISVDNHFVVYKLMLRPPVFHLISRDDKIIDEKGFEYKSFGVYIVTDKKLELPPSARIILEGRIRPDPKTQRATFVAIGVEFPESVDQFDKDTILRLKSRFEGLTVKQRKDWILEEFEKYSHLVGRKNLSYVSFLTAFTPVWVTFDNDRQRGWGIILIIGDTTTGKSETVRKVILLLKGGTMITAETASTVGLTAAAVKSEKGEWRTDFGFLVLNDRGLLAIDGYQKLSKHASSKLAETERQGVVTKSTASKGSAPARTRQVKIANAVDLNAGKYSTKAVSEFFYPIQTVPTVLDKTVIARLDITVISDQRSVDAKAVNTLQTTSHDPDLDFLSEVLKWAWSSKAVVSYTEDAVLHILGESTRLYRQFYCDSIPLVSIDFKFKLARLSTALAYMTLSTDDELKQLLVTKEHVAEVVSFIEGEYIEAGLHAVAKSEVIERPTEEDLESLMQDLEGLDIPRETAINILRFIVLKAHVTKNVLKTRFSLANHNQLRPLVATLQGHGLLKSGRGYYPTAKMIQLVKLYEKNNRSIFSEGVKGVTRVKMDNFSSHVDTIVMIDTPRNDTLPENPGVESELEKDSETLERRSLIIDEAVRILREIGHETFQKILRDKLESRDYAWEEAGPILRADNQFRFMGMMVALKEETP